MKRNKIILVGTSPIVEFHVNALRKSGLNPTTVASSNKNSSSQEKFSAENNIKKSYSDWKNMIDEEEYDGILIAARVESTIEILEYAIKQNIPILVEKPVSVNSKDIKKLIKNSHEMIMVGYNRRFYKTVNVLKNFVLEENTPVIASMIAPESSNIMDFFNNSSHSVDMLRYIFGEIKLEYVKKLIVNDMQKGLVATFSNDRKDVIQFIGNWNASDNFGLSVFRDKKRFELKPYEKLNIYNEMDVIEPTSSSPIRKYVPKLIDRVNLEPLDEQFKPGFYQQSNAFSELIRNKKKMPSAASLNDALKNIEICEELVGKYNDLI